MADPLITIPPTTAPTPVVIKEGHVSVRGHFMWRERYVVVEPGRVTVMRSGKGAVKAKIDLLDASVRIVFHEDNAQLTIASHAHATVLSCGSSHDRNEWVSALFTAKGNHAGDTDCEASDLVMSSMEEFEKELLGARDKTSSIGSAERDSNSMDDNDGSDQEYNDTLLAFQDLRSSMMKCQRSLIDNDDDVCHSQIVDERAVAASVAVHPHTNETAGKQRNLTAIVAFVHAVQHGGRAVLLHLDVIDAVCNISLEEILHAIGEKQRDKQATTNSTAVGLQKLHVATFVRYILFHPVYAKRPEIQQRTAAIDALVDRYFPHCRLRRFSHDIEQGASAHAFELDVSWQRKDSESDTTGSSSGSSVPLHAARVAPLTIAKPDAAALKKKRHSFPNILLPLQLGGLTTQPSLARMDSSILTPLQAKRSSSDHLTDSPTKNDSDLFLDEVLPEPLRNVLWKFSCQQVAEQLSIFHQHQLAQLTLWEFVHAPKHEAKRVTDHFNRLVAYLVWSVLVEDTAKDRAEVIECIISIATAASAAPLYNFHLVMACVGCLGDTPLMHSRLPLTWKRVRAKFKTQLGALRTLCDHAGGFETLRKRQAAESSKGSCIPFIGVIGVTLERLRLVPYTSETVGLLDVDKLDRQYLAVGTIESAMLRPYKIHELDELQLWVRVKMEAMDTFVSPRLLQLRSQQLLANETAQQSGSRHSSLYRSRNSPGSTGSADGAGDGGPPLLPFREICSLLVTTRDVSERIHVCVEALLADDQQPLTLRLRRFHQDFKQSACHSACHVVLANVRNAVDALKRDLLTHKSFEIMQLTGLDDSAIQLERGLYTAVHQAVTKPIATWLFTKLRHAFAEEDARLCGLLEAYHQDGASSGRQRRGGSLDNTSQSPLDLLESLTDASFEGIPQESDQVARVRHAREVLSTWTKAPFSVLCLLQQSLDIVFVPRELRDTLELLDTALSSLGCKRLSSRASMAVTCGGSSSNRGSMSSFGSFRSSASSVGSSSSKRLLPPTGTVAATVTAKCAC